MSCGILVPRPGIELIPPAVAAQSLNHWTSKQLNHPLLDGIHKSCNSPFCLRLDFANILVVVVMDFANIFVVVVMVLCCMLSCSIPTLCHPMNCSLQASLSLGILQARILKWVAMSSSREIFPTQALNPDLPHCRQILYSLSHEDHGMSQRKLFFFF